jgi:hypothetical protein
MTRGMTLNNPCNVMETRTVWQGQIKPTSDTERRLAQFVDIPHGIRAAARIFYNYAHLENLKTVRLMISRWAPENENPTGDYIKFVADGLGVGPDDILNVHNTNTLFSLIKLIIRFEQGGNVCVDSDIAAGISMAVDEPVA